MQFIRRNKIDYSQITPEVQRLAETCIGNNFIDPQMYLDHKVFRGLRDLNGNGVLTGLTEVSEIQASEMVNGVKESRPGQLFYRGIAIETLVDGFLKENRFGFEEVVYLLMFGQLPNADELQNFKDMLARYRSLPTSFVRDIILKAPSFDMMNTLARSVLTM